MGLDGLDYPGLPWAVGAGAVAVHGFPWSTEGLGKASKASRVLLERWEQKAGSLVMSTWLTVKFLVQKCNWKPFLFLELWALSWQSRFSKTNTETKAESLLQLGQEMRTGEWKQNSYCSRWRRRALALQLEVSEEFPVLLFAQRRCLSWPELPLKKKKKRAQT